MAEEVGITRWLRALEKADERRLRAGCEVTSLDAASAVIHAVTAPRARAGLPHAVARVLDWRAAYDLGLVLPPAETMPLPGRIRLDVGGRLATADVVIDDARDRAVVVVTGHVPEPVGPRELRARVDGTEWHVRVVGFPTTRYTVIVCGPDGVTRTFRVLFGRSAGFGGSITGALLRRIPSRTATRRAFEIALAAARVCDPVFWGDVRLALVPLGRTPDTCAAGLPPVIEVFVRQAIACDSWLARLADEGDAAAALFARTVRRLLTDATSVRWGVRFPSWWPMPRLPAFHQLPPPVRLVPNAPRARLVRLADRLLHRLAARGHADLHEFRTTDGRLVARLWVPNSGAYRGTLTLVDRAFRRQLRGTGMLRLTHEDRLWGDGAARTLGDVLLAPGVVIRRDPIAAPVTAYVHRADDPAAALRLFLAFAPDAEIVRFPSGARGERFARLLQAVMPAVRVRSFGARRAPWADALCGLANRSRLPGGFVTLDLEREDRP